MNVTNVLKEFTDTLLFEYDCDSARLEFTPAAPAVLGLPDLLPLRGDAGGRGLTEAADKLRRLLRAARPGGPVIKAEVAFLGQDGQIWVYLCRPAGGSWASSPTSPNGLTGSRICCAGPVWMCSPGSIIAAPKR